MTTSTHASNAAKPSALEWLIAHAALSEDGGKAATDATDIDSLIALLRSGGHPADALKVLAAALPPREGIWWAWASATHASKLVGDKGATEPVLAALAATERWIAAPDDANRRAAWAASDAAGTDSAAGCAAAATFFADGSIGPADIAPIPPPAGLNVTMVGLAVILASAIEAAHFDALAGAYIAQALEVVKQLGGWDRSVELARTHFDSQHSEHLKVTRPTPPPAT